MNSLKIMAAMRREIADAKYYRAQAKRASTPEAREKLLARRGEHLAEVDRLATMLGRGNK